MSYSKPFLKNTNSDTVLELNWEAIEHNIKHIKSQLSDSTLLMLMVKAAAYGHGTQETVVKIVENKLADYLGVATVFEGVELRKLGIELPILVQNVNHSEWKQLLEHCLEPVLHNFEGIASFQEFLSVDGIVSRKDYPVHIEFNTGMNRFGFDEEEADELIALLKQERDWEVRSVMCHLSSAGNLKAESYTISQIRSFEAIIEKLKPHLPRSALFHVLNTDGIENYSSYEYDMVRLGIGLYGASASEHYRVELKQVAKFVSKVAAIRTVEKGEKVSYNRKGEVNETANIAVLSLGYADGFPRKMGNGNWEVEINGKLYPTIGNVCMDSCMILLGKDTASVGDDAIIFGGKKSIFDMAIAQETISYEVLTSIGSRVRRILC